MDIRKETCLIIRKNGEFLVGRKMLSCGLRWSGSKYDAWRTRDRAKAEKLAFIVGGIVMLFNPIANQIRVL
jgi:hypothetical protein